MPPRLAAKTTIRAAPAELGGHGGSGSRRSSGNKAKVTTIDTPEMTDGDTEHFGPTQIYLSDGNKCEEDNLTNSYDKNIAAFPEHYIKTCRKSPGL